MSEGDRIGLLVPSSNTTMEGDFHRIAPAGVTVHTGRLYLETVGVDAWKRMNEDLVRESKYLATADVDVIVYGCTGASFEKGAGYDRQMARVIFDATGVPTATTSTALVDALKTLGLKRVALATPYPPAVLERGRAFLVGNGFEVLRPRGLGYVRNTEIGRLESESGYALARQIDGPDVEGFVLSCTNWRVIDAIERIEEELGKPVVTSNQASIWSALKALGCSTPIKGFGILLSDHLADAGSPQKS